MCGKTNLLNVAFKEIKMDYLGLIKSISVVLFAYVIQYRISESKNTLSFFRRLILITIYITMSASLFIIGSLYGIIEPIRSILNIAFLSGINLIIAKSKLKYSVLSWTVAYVGSCILYLISAFISSVFLVPMTGEGADVSNVLFTIVFEAIFTFSIYKRKFKFTIKHEKITSVGVAFSGIALLIYGVLYDDNPLTNNRIILSFLGIVLCGFGLYWWLKKESISAFNDKVQEIKTEKLQEKIVELTDKNLELEKTIHTDSKKLPAYRELVERVIAESGATQDRLKMLELLRIAQMEAIVDLSKEICEEVQNTGMPLIDNVLHHNSRRCSKCGIKFRSVGTTHIKAITQSQLETLIANLLDNAVNAFKNHNDINERYITVQFLEDAISITDNGKVFSDSVLADLERCREMLTPNREGSGVGIGWVTIFEITNKCRASVEIAENNGFKSVTVRFDGENRLVTDKTKIIQ